MGEMPPHTEFATVDTKELILGLFFQFLFPLFSLFPRETDLPRLIALLDLWFRPFGGFLSLMRRWSARNYEMRLRKPF